MGLTDFIQGRRLVDAALSGDARGVETLLKDGAHTNSVKNGATALIAASKSGHSQITAMLLERDADHGQPDANDWTPLMWACAEGHPECAELLLRAGSDPNHADGDGYTSLMAAAEAGSAAITLDLLKHGAYCDAKDSNGWTSLMFAAREGHHDIILALLDHGAEPEAGRDIGVTALMLAAYAGHEAIVQSLIERGADVEASGPDGKTSVLLAYEQGRQGVVNILMSHGAQVPHFPPAGTCRSRSPQREDDEEEDERISTEEIAYTEMEPMQLVMLDLHDMAADVEDDYSNVIVNRVNDHVARLAVSRRDFHWHKHERSDEMFVVIEGALMVDLEGRTETLTPGQMITIPKQVQHRTRAQGRAVTLCFTKDDTSIIGD